MSDGNIAFGTNNGIYIYTQSGQLVHHLTQSDGLASNTINELYVDKGGNLWASTNQNINFIEYNSPLRQFFDAEEQGVEIRTTYELNGRLFIGTDKGLFIWEGREWVRKLPEISIWDFGHIGKSLLIGAREGLFLYQEGNFTKLKNYFSRIITVSEKYERLAYIYNLGEKSIEALWQLSNGTFNSYTLSEFSEPIYTLIEDKNGDLWRGTGNWGIYRDQLLQNDGLPKLQQTIHYTQEHGLPAPSFNYTTKIAGEVGFITEEGLFRFDEKQKSIQRDLRFVEAFPPESRQRSWPTVEDKLGHVWLDFGGARVFEMIPDNDGNYQLNRGPYGRLDVLGNVKQILSINERYALFATSSDVFLFDRVLQEAPRHPFNTLVRNITVGGDSLIWGGYGPIETKLNNEIHYTQKSIRFNWSATTYFPSMNPLYRFRLVGLDEEWSNWTDETYRDFNNLREGNYTFEVQSNNIYDVTGKTASVNFTILPPWYRSWWAYGFYLAFGFIGIAITVNRMVKWRIHQQMLAMKAEQAEKLKKLDIVKSQFFSNVSHELRTPLTLTIGPLEDLKKSENRLSETALSKVSLALRNSKRLLTLVTEILDISRLEAADKHIVVGKYNLSSFVESVIQNFSPLASRNDIKFSVETPPKLNTWFNRDHMDKVLTNLLSNAFKFTPTGKEISVRLENHADYAIIQVRDCGMGIPQEDLPFIFDRFYQSSNSTSRLQKGTGIGLSLVKHLVELHGGSIKAESELGKGTVFTVKLPHNADTLPYAEIEQGAHFVSKNTSQSLIVDGEEISDFDNSSGLDNEDHTTVLIVEDNHELREFITGHLREHYRVIEALNGKQGLEKAKEFLPDLIVSDVMMPEMNGFEMVEQLRNDATINFIPVIMLTGKDTKEDKLQGLEFGANDYLVKPFDMDELKARIKSMMLSQRLLKAKFESQKSVFAVDKEKLKSADQKFIEQVQAVILENLDDSSLSVEKLAEMVNVGRTTLHRKLTAILGESPVKLIRRIRLQQAKAMIENKSGSISEIAYSVGFESISWFSKCFKEEYEVNPSELLN